MVLGAFALIFAGLAGGADDSAGRVLYLAAFVVLVVVAGGDLLVNPRLRVDGAGLSVRTPLARRRMGWAAVDSVRVDERLRLGLAARTLEIDAGDDLFVLSGRSLGADPRAVAEVIEAFRGAAQSG